MESTVQLLRRVALLLLAGAVASLRWLDVPSRLRRRCPMRSKRGCAPFLLPPPRCFWMPRTLRCHLVLCTTIARVWPRQPTPLWPAGSGSILNPEYWHAAATKVSTSSLGELRPREGSYWINATPEHPGSLLLASGEQTQITHVVRAALETLEATDASTYTSPLHNVHFLYVR